MKIFDWINNAREVLGLDTESLRIAAGMSPVPEWSQDTSPTFGIRATREAQVRVNRERTNEIVRDSLSEFTDNDDILRMRGRSAVTMQEKLFPEHSRALMSSGNRFLSLGKPASASVSDQAVLAEQLKVLVRVAEEVGGPNCEIVGGNECLPSVREAILGGVPPTDVDTARYLIFTEPERGDGQPRRSVGLSYGVGGDLGSHHKKTDTSKVSYDTETTKMIRERLPEFDTGRMSLQTVVDGVVKRHYESMNPRAWDTYPTQEQAARMEQATHDALAEGKKHLLPMVSDQAKKEMSDAGLLSFRAAKALRRGGISPSDSIDRDRSKTAGLAA